MSEAARPTVRQTMLNSASHFGSYLLNTALAVVVSIVVVRHLGRAEYGVLAFVVAYLSFFQMLTSLGTDTIVIREACQKPEAASALVGGALSLRLALSIATMLLAWAIVPFVATSRRVSLLVMLYSLTFLFSYGTLLLVGFTAELRSHIPNAVLGIWAVVFVLMRLGLVLMGAQVVHLLVADVAGSVVVYYLRRQVAWRFSSLRPRFRIDTELWSRLLRQGWPVALCAVLIDVHARVDQMLLFRLRGAEELGGYAAATRLSEVWGVITSVVTVSLLPLLARDATSAPERAERTRRLAYRYLYIFILPVAIGLGLYSAPILELVLGGGFVQSAPALTLLAAAEVALFSNSVTYNALFSAGQQGEAAVMAGVALLANVLLNLWLIPAAGGSGAALASLITYALVPVVGLILPGARAVATNAFRSLVKPALAAFLPLALLLALRPGLVAGLALLALSYPVGLVVTGALDRTDWDLLKRVRTGT